jgi:hypothetical protein
MDSKELLKIQELKETADNMKKIVVGLIIAEYGIRAMNDTAKHDLKQRTRIAINSILSVQNYFLHHPQSTKEQKEIFKKTFIKNEMFMLSELVVTAWGFDDATLEEIINAFKGNIKQQEVAIIND